MMQSERVEPGLRTGFLAGRSNQPVRRPGSTRQCVVEWRAGVACSCLARGIFFYVQNQGKPAMLRA